MGFVSDIFSKDKIILEMSNRRKALCRDCEYHNKILNQCNVCGCFVNLKTKVVNEKCPKGKW